MRSATKSFGGANIKGTPAMKSSAVRSDVRKITNKVDVFVVQEFRHAWYWVTVRALLAFGWRSDPPFAKAVANPLYGGQGVFWKRKFFRKTTSKVIEAFDFALDNSGIMENRWMRAVLLTDKATELQCWFATTHFVVHGDDHAEGERRQRFMKQNLNNFDKLLGIMARSDAPIVFEGDLNIHQGTWAYVELQRIIHKYKGRIIGTPGVEYMIVFDDHCATKIHVVKNYVLTPKAEGLNTDHEVRCMDFYLQR